LLEVFSSSFIYLQVFLSKERWIKHLSVINKSVFISVNFVVENVIN